MLVLLLAAAAASAGAPAQPKVVATSPAQGATVRPGAFPLSVTYDRPMLDGDYSFVRVSAETYPDCETQPTRSPDGRTFSLRCTGAAGKRYEVWFNRPPFMNFKAPDRSPAHPYRLRFRTEAR